jgi:ABC-type transport system involved in cytochrome c biogenesis permease subunit
VAVQLLQWTSALYLGAGLVAGLGLALATRRFERASVVLLGIGATVHAVSFAFLHTASPTPALTAQPAAISFMSWVGTVFYLLMLWRTRVQRLVALVAPAAFLGAFLAALRLPGVASQPVVAAGSWPHAHVLLASAGLSLFGLAGLAGMMFLVEHRRLKGKRPIDLRMPLPSLEALDRVNSVALGIGFPLLTLGVLTGIMWLRTEAGTAWTGSPHETWSVVAWVIYAVLVGARFVAHQTSRQAAASAVGGFAFLFFAVIGLEWVS